MPGSYLCRPMDIEPTDIPAVVGAYRLVVSLPHPLNIALPGRRPATLLPGYFAYCGSAYGPGGLRARIARHLDRTKTPHWHIDRLTAQAPIVELHLEPDSSECEILDDLLARPGVAVPIPRFGSSDCRRCPAHLVSLPVELVVAKPARQQRHDDGQQQQ